MTNVSVLVFMLIFSLSELEPWTFNSSTHWQMLKKLCDYELVCYSVF